MQTHMGAREIARRMWFEGGGRVFWNGVGVCLVRAFVVNAFTFLAYEWAVQKLKGEGEEDGVLPLAMAI